MGHFFPDMCGIMGLNFEPKCSPSKTRLGYPTPPPPPPREINLVVVMIAKKSNYLPGKKSLELSKICQVLHVLQMTILYLSSALAEKMARHEQVHLSSKKLSFFPNQHQSTRAK